MREGLVSMFVDKGKELTSQAIESETNEERDKMIFEALE